jgi:hypothetical protein
MAMAGRWLTEARMADAPAGPIVGGTGWEMLLAWAGGVVLMVWHHRRRRPVGRTGVPLAALDTAMPDVVTIRPLGHLSDPLADPVAFQGRAADLGPAGYRRFRRPQLPPPAPHPRSTAPLIGFAQRLAELSQLMAEYRLQPQRPGAGRGPRRQADPLVRARFEALMPVDDTQWDHM